MRNAGQFRSWNYPLRKWRSPHLNKSIYLQCSASGNRTRSYCDSNSPPHRSSTPMFPAAQEATRRRAIRSHKISAFPAGSSGFFSYSLPAVNPAASDTTREDRLASLSARRSQILAKKGMSPFRSLRLIDTVNRPTRFAQPGQFRRTLSSRSLTSLHYFDSDLLIAQRTALNVSWWSFCWWGVLISRSSDFHWGPS